MVVTKYSSFSNLHQLLNVFGTRKGSKSVLWSQDTAIPLPTHPVSWPLTEGKLLFFTAQSLVGNTLLMLLLVHSCPSFSHFSQPLSIYLFTPLPAVDFPQGWFYYLRVFFFLSRQKFPHLCHAHAVPWAEVNWVTDPFPTRSKQWFTNYSSELPAGWWPRYCNS